MAAEPCARPSEGIVADLNGFAGAQRKLRANFGEAITFLGPPVSTWPPGTPLDPETQLPYDPVLEATTTTNEQSVVCCNVAYRANRGPSGESASNALGWLETGDMMLIADITDRPLIDGKASFVARGEHWDIHATVADGIGGVQRYLVYGRKR